MSLSLVRNTLIPNFNLESCFTTGLNSCDSTSYGTLLVYLLFNMWHLDQITSFNRLGLIAYLSYYLLI